ncbi:endo-1,4-beta-xylanase [Micromonospora sp. AMSO31t]|uniref:endo-1,4-beta-xylanase n=1 Tax=Micromonospora sp. AMSO31t TaxID=2650566 RepID=UPI001CED1D63|nr:endo-1,4-beta-xylanase [Micromonospora sp. AMSO31t]
MTADSRRSSRSTLLLAVTLALGAVLLATLVVVTASGHGRSTGPSVAGSATPSPPAPTPERDRLRDLMPPGVRIGTAIDGRALSLDSTYRDVLATEFDTVTAENAMKWRNLEPSEGVYAWVGADQLIDFAQRGRQSVYGHTLVWHNDVPQWVSPDWSPERLRAVLRAHVTAVVSHYRDRVWAWDVVNEALDEDGTLRDTLWLRKLGPGYIADAFRWAHAADPSARLFINDYGTEERSRKSDALLRLVRDLRAQGVPVDGVGFQAHLESARRPAGLAANLRRFAALGVSVAITELDVRVKLPAGPAQLRQQAAVYRDVLAACLSVPACVSLTVWGFTDARSWIPGYHRGYGAACLLDAQYRPKPAHTAMIELLGTRRPRGPGG